MNKNENKNSGHDTDNRDLLFIGAIPICAIFYKYRFAIEYWFHENMVELVLGAIGVFTLLGYIFVKRMKHKNKEQIERMERLRYNQSPKRNVQAFYNKPAAHGRRDLNE